MFIIAFIIIIFRYYDTFRLPATVYSDLLHNGKEKM